MSERPLRVAVVMDPIETIKPAKDTTLAMLLAAQRRGWQLSYCELQDLWLRDGVAMARAHPLEVRDDAKNWFTREPHGIHRLSEFDVVLMRKDPPFDTEYIYSTYILERAEEQGALVVNRPRGLRDINEKVFTAWFPDCCAPTLITRDMGDMHAFLREQRTIVCKPLHGMGGRSIFVVELGDKNANAGVQSYDATRGVTADLVKHFNATVTCEKVTCLYNDVNWWIERLIANPEQLAELFWDDSLSICSLRTTRFSGRYRSSVVSWR